MRKSIAVALALLSLGACGRAGYSPLPDQRPAITQDEPPVDAFLIRMANPSANSRIVRDIIPLPDMRWTAAKPAIRLALPDTGPWLARVEFRTTAEVFKAVGPQTITLRVNGQAVGNLTAEKPDRYEYSVPVPPGAITSNGSVVLEAEVRPAWVATDGVVLGVLLDAMGFVRP